MHEGKTPNIQPQVKLKSEGKTSRQRQQNPHSYCRKERQS